MKCMKRWYFRYVGWWSIYCLLWRSTMKWQLVGQDIVRSVGYCVFPSPQVCPHFSIGLFSKTKHNRWYIAKLSWQHVYFYVLDWWQFDPSSALTQILVLATLTAPLSCHKNKTVLAFSLQWAMRCKTIYSDPTSRSEHVWMSLYCI